MPLYRCAIREGLSEEAQREQENAEQYLELADEALAEEQERYEQLQAEEALYRIEQELAN